jgi:hypothetical protein
MTKKIKCQPQERRVEQVKVKIIKAPIVDTRLLRQIIFSRARAIVL